jgi:outer membrane protein
MRSRIVLLCALLLCASASAPAAEPAGPQPRLELGVGALAMVLPDYRGSDRYGVRALPIPYAAYRSDRIQLTREGLRARLFSLDRLTASISGAASLTGAEDNPDRAGMPQLDPTFEMGPSLDYRLTGGDHDPLKLKLRLPARAVVATDGRHVDGAGWNFVPHLRLDYVESRGDWEWSFLGSLGLVFATEDHHEYFYGVAPQYADPALNRPAYDARGGYGGMRMSGSTVARRGKWRLGLFGSYDWMDGAAFDDSPLLKTTHALTAGVFLTYRLYASGVGEPLEGEEL